MDHPIYLLFQVTWGFQFLLHEAVFQKSAYHIKLIQQDCFATARPKCFAFSANFLDSFAMSQDEEVFACGFGAAMHKSTEALLDRWF